MKKLIIVLLAVLALAAVTATASAEKKVITFDDIAWNTAIKDVRTSMIEKGYMDEKYDFYGTEPYGEGAIVCAIHNSYIQIEEIEKQAYPEKYKHLAGKEVSEEVYADFQIAMREAEKDRQQRLAKNKKSPYILESFMEPVVEKLRYVEITDVRKQIAGQKVEKIYMNFVPLPYKATLVEVDIVFDRGCDTNAIYKALGNKFGMQTVTKRDSFDDKVHIWNGKDNTIALMDENIVVLASLDDLKDTAAKNKEAEPYINRTARKDDSNS